MAVMMFFMPETPYFLYKKGREAEARASLQWLRGKDYDITEEFEAMRKSYEVGRQQVEQIKTNH